MKTAAPALEAGWLDETHLLLNTGFSANALPRRWSIDLTNHEWTPVTRDFTLFFWISLTADRRTGVATRTERRSGIWLGSAIGEEGTFVVRESATWASSPVVDKG